ncbi:hypothetical protein AWN76_014785 [Rhodothermaceae bacterium RA]|nr:hypothetical protein AWN76_014785 [Rhodothermaceae bacterium RA]
MNEIIRPDGRSGWERGRFRTLSFALLGLGLLAVGCGESGDYLSRVPDPAFASSSDEVLGLEDAFEHRRSIPLDTSVIVGTVTYLDVDAQGRLLVTDHVSNKVFLFSSGGKHLRTLDAEPCHPGFNMRPIRAYFAPPGDIFLLNGGGPWGYWFTPDGACREGMSDEFMPPRLLAPGEDGYLYGLYAADQYEIRRMDRRGRTLSAFGRHDAFRNIVLRIEGGGIVQTGDHRLYVAFPFSPYVYVFEEEGQFVETLGWAPPYYRAVDKDLPMRSSRGQLAEAIRDLGQRHSMTYNLLLLEPSVLMVQHINPYRDEDEEVGIVLLTTDGRVLNEGAILTDHPFLAARNGLAYTSVQPEVDAAGYLPNPSIEVYRRSVSP